MIMRDASLKQRMPCITILCISIFRAFSVEKSAHYTWVNTVEMIKVAKAKGRDICFIVMIIIIIIIIITKLWYQTR